MKEIPLTQGKVALVDDSDFACLSRFKWCARRASKRDLFYACRKVNGKHLKMDKVIMGNPPVPGLTPDHKDGNGLNNQRSNLRWATRAQQIYNTTVSKRNRSGFKGVRLTSSPRITSPWQAQIQIKGKYLFLGCFATPELAAAAYNAAAVKHFGEFARLNPIP